MPVELVEIGKLVNSSSTKIVLLVMDGLGGLPRDPRGLTELETAQTPNLDALAKDGICGLHQVISAGITPGSGPAHLALFGYDPFRYFIGRGVLEGIGIGFDLKPEDVAARGNFSTINDEGKIIDRRAGRISTQKNIELSKRLREIEIPGVEIFIEPIKEYRVLLVLRGEGLSAQIKGTDPQGVNVEISRAEALSPEAKHTARVVNEFTEKARTVLSDQEPANMVFFRGFSQRPALPQMQEVFGINAAAIAQYPMYKGLSRLVGMDILESGQKTPQLFETLDKNWDAYDFFYVHVKAIDSAGEDGDFEAKTALIEEVDKLIPRMMNLNPDVVVVTGDHSTPAFLKLHSWHPVPVLLWSRYCRPDPVQRFGERDCLAGALGPRLPAVELLPIALANAGRLNKYGA
jgi:2,3-bisphosphoglycerate-independent phosphoglycerate mutase